MSRLLLPFSALVLLILAGFVAFGAGADVAREFANRSHTFERAEGVQLVRGNCTSKLVLSLCDLQIRDSARSKVQKIDYIFLGHQGAQSVSLLRSTTDRSFVTTDLGRDNLVNRILAVLAGTLLLLAGVWSLVRAALKPQPQG